MLKFPFSLRLTWRKAVDFVKLQRTTELPWPSLKLAKRPECPAVATIDPTMLFLCQHQNTGTSATQKHLFPLQASCDRPGSPHPSFGSYTKLYQMHGIKQFYV